MDILEKLKMLGLNEKEARVYSAAIELGTFSVLSLSNKSKIKRPTCYLVLEELSRQGLVSKIPRPKKILYTVEDPEILIEKLRSRLTVANQVLPELKNAMSIHKPATIKFFTGRSSVENVYRDMIETKKPIKGIISSKNLFEAAGKEFLLDWGEKRKKYGVNIDSLYTEKFGFMTDPDKLRRVKMLPSNLKITGSFAVYGDKVAFLASKNTEFSFVVSNKEYSESVASIFDYFWNINDKLE